MCGVTAASEALHKLQMALVERDCWKDLGDDVGVVFRRTLRKYDGIAWSSHLAEDTEK
jgi:pantothenate synthetase